MVLGGFVGGFGSFWVVLDGFGWFRVLVTTLPCMAIRRPGCKLIGRCSCVI